MALHQAVTLRSSLLLFHQLFNWMSHFLLIFFCHLRQVVHTYVPLSPSSIAWYWPKGGDALWLGR